MAVQEGKHVRRGRVRAVHPRPHQTLPLLVPDDPDLLDLGQLLAVGRVVAEVVHQDDLLDEVLGAAVQDADNCSEQCGASLVVERNDDRRRGKVLGVLFLVAHGAAGVGDGPVGGEGVGRALVEPVPQVGVLAGAEAAAGHVLPLVEVVPAEAGVGGRGERAGASGSGRVCDECLRA